MIQLLCGLVGYFRLEISNELGCKLVTGETRSGHWLYYDQTASSYITLHILVIIVQCAATNLTLYKVPKSFGLFDRSKEEVDLSCPLVAKDA